MSQNPNMLGQKSTSCGGDGCVAGEATLSVRQVKQVKPYQGIETLHQVLSLLVPVARCVRYKLSSSRYCHCSFILTLIQLI
jgi:hypothetical protein